MIDVSDTVRAILGGSYEYRFNAQAWLGDELLATDVPVTAGSEETDRSLRVPERLTLTVPKRAFGTDWTPSDEDSPLAANGQTLKISLGIGQGPDGIAWFQRGEFLIQETDQADDGETLTVTAVGLLALIDEARFIAPFQPTGTVAATARALVEPALTIDMTAAPADKALPSSPVNFDVDRLAAFYELIDTWPASVRMNEGGYLQVLPDDLPTTADIVAAYTSGTGGTVITAAGKSTRDGAFNAVLATGYQPDGTEVRGTQYVPTGPWAYPGGQANPLPVPYVYSSPLIGDRAGAYSAARSIMRNKLRQAARRAYSITAVPDPTLQIGDVVTITCDYGTDLLCTVEAISLPLFATGPMKIKVVTVD